MKRFLLLAAMGVLLSGCGAAVESSSTVSPNSTSAGGALSESPASVLFREGAGGDAAWWESHRQDAITEDEKTAAGFVLAVLKRDIGAVAGRPAGIDAFVDPSKPELKQKLAIYDISSPSVREIRFAKLTKDDTGTLYAFQVTGGTSTDDFKGFAGELRIHASGSTHLIDDIPAATFHAVK